MQPHKVVSHDEWIAARKAHLTEEKAFISKARDELSRKRRELPWEKVEKKYVFEGPDGKETLADLFGGKSQLIVYHFMLGPGWEAGCPSCSYLADHFDGPVVHLAQRDVSFVVVSRAPFAEIKKFRDRMGWKFKWVSSFESDFNYDYQVSATPEQKATDDVLYNYERTSFPSTELPGASVFSKNEAGQVLHTYSSYGRGLDMLIGTYHFLDIAPKGREEAGLSFSMAWVRHHDRYEGAVVDTKAPYQQPKSASCCE
ncbi:MAG: thioredoxin family protein [Xanthobacteraceae bacterium]